MGMKQSVLLFAIILLGLASYSQRDRPGYSREDGPGYSQGDGPGIEFHTYPNGLIYNDSTMGRLKFIVDSLQLKFKHCDLTRDYHSVRQGKAHAIVWFTPIKRHPAKRVPKAGRKPSVF